MSGPEFPFNGKPDVSPSTAPDPLLTRFVDRRRFLRTAGLAGGLLATGGLTSFLSACSAGSSPSASPASPVSSSGGKGGAGTIGVSLNVANAYSSYVAEGVYEALKGSGYDVRIVVNNAESSTELSNVQRLLAAGVKALLMLPVNAETAAKSAELCAARSLPFGVAQWPTKEPQKNFTSAAWADWTKKGQLMGEFVKSNAKPGKLIVVQAILGQQYSELIDDGLDKALAGSGFEIAVREQGFYDRTKATNIVQTGLQANPDVTGVITYSASMGNGVAQYLKSANKSGLTHVTSDCDTELLTWLKTPFCNATAYHSAGQSGLLVAKALRTQLEGGAPTYLATLDQAVATGSDIADVVARTPFEYPEFASKVSTL